MQQLAIGTIKFHPVHNCIFGPLLLFGLIPFPLAVILLMSGGIVWLISMPNIWLSPLFVTFASLCCVKLTRNEPMLFEIISIGFRYSRTVWYRGGRYVV